MFKSSADNGPKGEAARIGAGLLSAALGLTPHGTQISGHRRDDTAHG